MINANIWDTLYFYYEGSVLLQGAWMFVYVREVIRI